MQLGNTGQNKDAWMVGYTPQLSTAIWIGTDDGTALVDVNGASVYGSGLPAQIWKQAMNNALAGKPVTEFPEPEAIGGQAGIPYEAPPTTYQNPTPTTRPQERPNTSPDTSGPRQPTPPRPSPSTPR